MARPYRLQSEDCFYHITNRGDDRKKIYVSEYDYEKFLEYLLKAKKRFEFYVYAYVLMPNHYHLLIKTLHANISKLMHYINGSYTTYYNIKCRKVGHLFQGRYKSIVIDSDTYFSTLSRYIHLNPVKAKLVELPEKYKWSSYPVYLTKMENGIVDKGEVSKVLDMSIKQYREFVLDGIGKTENPFKDLYGGFLLGSAEFIEDKLDDLKGQVEGEEFSYKKAFRRNISVEDIDSIMEEKYGNGIKEMRAKRSWPMRDKRVTIYLMRELTGLNNKEIGAVFGMNPSAVSKAARTMEKDIDGDSHVRKEIRQLFSIFEG